MRFCVHGSQVGAGVALVVMALAGSAAATGWSVQPTPSPTTSSEFLGVSCASSAACTAVGDYGSTLAEAWNGQRWTIQSTPNPTGASNRLNGVSCVSRSACTAVGDSLASAIFQPFPLPPKFATLAEAWNGTGWTIQSTSNPVAMSANLLGVSCTSRTVCTAVGLEQDSSGNDLTLAEAWNGRRWTIQATPNPTGTSRSPLRGVSCPSSTACTAVGSYVESSGKHLTLAEAWNGRRWTIRPTPTPTGGGELNAVSCTSSTACTAVGDRDRSAQQFDAGGGLERAALADSDDPDPPGATFNELQGVSCASTAACTAVGRWLNTSGGGTLAERWDGRRWSIQPTPTSSDGGELDGASCESSTTCTAVGSEANISASSGTLAQRWTATGGAQLVRARARLAGIGGTCVPPRFTARIRGSAISSVTWLLDGKRIRGRTVHRGTEYAAAIILSPGSHRLTVKVKFKTSTHSPARIFKRTVAECPPSLPKFTG